MAESNAPQNLSTVAETQGTQEKAGEKVRSAEEILYGGLGQNIYGKETSQDKKAREEKAKETEKKAKKSVEESNTDERVDKEKINKRKKIQKSASTLHQEYDKKRKTIVVEDLSEEDEARLKLLQEGDPALKPLDDKTDLEDEIKKLQDEVDQLKRVTDAGKEKAEFDTIARLIEETDERNRTQAQKEFLKQHKHISENNLEINDAVNKGQFDILRNNKTTILSESDPTSQEITKKFNQYSIDRVNSLNEKQKELDNLKEQQTPQLKLDRLNQEISSIEDTQDKLDEIDQAYNKVSGNPESYFAQDHEYNKNLAEIKSKQKEINGLQRKVKKSNPETQKLEKLQEEIKDLQNRNKSLKETEENRLINERTAQEATIDLLNQKIAERNKTQIQIEQRKNQAQVSELYLNLSLDDLEKEIERANKSLEMTPERKKIIVKDGKKPEFDNERNPEYINLQNTIYKMQDALERRKKEIETFTSKSFKSEAENFLNSFFTEVNSYSVNEQTEYIQQFADELYKQECIAQGDIVQYQKFIDKLFGDVEDDTKFKSILDTIQSHKPLIDNLNITKSIIEDYLIDTDSISIEDIEKKIKEIGDKFQVIPREQAKLLSEMKALLEIKRINEGEINIVDIISNRNIDDNDKLFYIQELFDFDTDKPEELAQVITYLVAVKSASEEYKTALRVVRLKVARKLTEDIGASDFDPISNTLDSLLKLDGFNETILTKFFNEDDARTFDQFRDYYRTLLKAKLGDKYLEEFVSDPDLRFADIRSGRIYKELRKFADSGRISVYDMEEVLEYIEYGYPDRMSGTSVKEFDFASTLDSIRDEIGTNDLDSNKNLTEAEIAAQKNLLEATRILTKVQHDKLTRSVNFFGKLIRFWKSKRIALNKIASLITLTVGIGLGGGLTVAAISSSSWPLLIAGGVVGAGGAFGAYNLASNREKLAKDLAKWEANNVKDVQKAANIEKAIFTNRIVGSSKNLTDNRMRALMRERGFAPDLAKQVDTNQKLFDYLVNNLAA